MPPHPAISSVRARRRWCGPRRRRVVPDVIFVVLTVALFAALALAVRAVEKL
jgi:hypothetical protein